MRGRRRIATQVAEQRLGHDRRYVHAASGDFADRAHQLIARALLVEVAGSTGANRAHRILIFTVHTQHQHRQFGARFLDQLDQLNAAAAGHRHVGDEYVPRLIAHHLQHVVAIGGFARHHQIIALGEDLL